MNVSRFQNQIFLYRILNKMKKIFKKSIRYHYFFNKLSINATEKIFQFTNVRIKK